MNWKEKLGRSDLLAVVPSQVDPDVHHAKLHEAICELNARGISIMALPISTRCKAFEIEQEITNAINAGDQAVFDRALKSWQECFD